MNDAAASTTSAVPGGGRDPFIAALARYVEALHARYPEGADQMRQEALDARGNMPRMCKSGRGRAA